MNKDGVINNILQFMQEDLNTDQLNKLKDGLIINLYGCTIEKENTELSCDLETNESIIKNFVGTKLLEGKKKSSMKQYIMVINDFFNFTLKNIRDIKAEDIKMYLATYKQRVRKISNITMNNKRRYLNSFFQWCEENEYVEKNVCKKIKEIKTEKRIKPIISDEQAELLRDECKNDLRDLAIIELCFSTGLRVSELEVARVGDIDFSTNEIVIHGIKNNQDRMGFLTPRSKIALRKYLFYRGNPNPDEYLFTTSIASERKMSKNNYEKIIKKYSKLANIPICTIHSIRRYFATYLKKKGFADVYIAQLLGHKSIQTTRNHYMFVSNDTVKQAFMNIA